MPFRSSRSPNATSRCFFPRRARARSCVARVTNPRRLCRPVNSSESARSPSALRIRCRSIAKRSVCDSSDPSNRPFTRQSCAPARTALSARCSSPTRDSTRNGATGFPVLSAANGSRPPGNDRSTSTTSTVPWATRSSAAARRAIVTSSNGSPVDFCSNPSSNRASAGSSPTNSTTGRRPSGRLPSSRRRPMPVRRSASCRRSTPVRASNVTGMTSRRRSPTRR